MPSPCTRRTALRVVGSSTALALAGCTASQDTSKSNASSSQGTPAHEPILTDDISLAVTLNQQFTAKHPARIRTTLTNTTETPITLSIGPTPPFTSYLSTGTSADGRLLLIPDVSDSSRDPLAWMGEDEDPIPATPKNGCWKITQDVVIEQSAISMELDPGETVNQQYAVYEYQNTTCLPPDEYRFADEATLQRGQLSSEAPTFTLALSVALTLHEDHSLSVSQPQATVREHEH